MKMKKSASMMVAAGVLATGVGVGVAAPAQAATLKGKWVSGSCSEKPVLIGNRDTVKIEVFLKQAINGKNAWKVTSYMSGPKLTNRKGKAYIVRRSHNTGAIVPKGQGIRYKVAWRQNITLLWCNIDIRTPIK